MEASPQPKTTRKKYFMKNVQYLMDNDEFDMLQEKYAGFDAIVIMVNEE